MTMRLLEKRSRSDPGGQAAELDIDEQNFIQFTAVRKDGNIDCHLFTFKFKVPTVC
jgi:hypothetical protein